MGGFDYSTAIRRDVTYQYIVVPVTSPEQLEKDRGIEVLNNSREIQAVKDEESGLVQAIFYHAGTLDISENIKLTMDAPGAVMLRMSDGNVKEIWVSDPSRSQKRMHLQITGMDKLSIDLPQGAYAGKSVIVDF